MRKRIFGQIGRSFSVEDTKTDYKDMNVAMENHGQGMKPAYAAPEIETDSITALQRVIAKDLLSIGAVFLRPEDPFTWASGIKSPIYCDNRLTLTSLHVRKDVEAGLAKLIAERFPECEAVMGTSTAGIAHAAITATILDLPMGYVRGSAKEHGRTNRIEGRLETGQKVVVVEDLISTGGSCIEVVETLREAGAEVLGVVSIFTYGMKAGMDKFAEIGVPVYSLSNFDVLVHVAAEEGYIKTEDINRLVVFRDNPRDEGWMLAGKR